MATFEWIPDSIIKYMIVEIKCMNLKSIARLGAVNKRYHSLLFNKKFKKEIQHLFPGGFSKINDADDAKKWLKYNAPQPLYVINTAYGNYLRCISCKGYKNRIGTVFDVIDCWSSITGEPFSPQERNWDEIDSTLGGYTTDKLEIWDDFKYNGSKELKQLKVKDGKVCEFIHAPVTLYDNSTMCRIDHNGMSFFDSTIHPFFRSLPRDADDDVDDDDT